MLEYLQKLSAKEQEQMQDVLQELYCHTFLPERIYDSRTGRMTANERYGFCIRHMDFLEEYLAVAGISIFENSRLGTIYIQGEPTIGQRLPRIATIYLLLFKLLYDEKMKEASDEIFIGTTFGELTAKAASFRLIRGLQSPAEVKRALNILKRYHLIEVLDTMDELNDQTVILIYPCINVVLLREDIRRLLAGFEEESNEE